MPTPTDLKSFIEQQTQSECGRLRIFLVTRKALAQGRSATRAGRHTQSAHMFEAFEFWVRATEGAQQRGTCLSCGGDFQPSKAGAFCTMFFTDDGEGWPIAFCGRCAERQTPEQLCARINQYLSEEGGVDVVKLQ
jgi:hypothetical protein